MKLIKAEIVGFGQYQQVTLDFSSQTQLLFGDNEAGKSTLYQFILAVLFGFPKKSKSQRDFTPRSGARFGGHLYLETASGPLKISRFKDEKNPTITSLTEGATIDEALFKKIIAPVTRDVFTTVFSFQQEQMQDWQNLSEESLQKLLLSLGLSGSETFLKQAEQWQNDYRALFLKAGVKPPLNQELVALKALQEKVVQQQQKEAGYQALVQEQHDLADTEREWQNRLATGEKQLAAAQKTALVKPLLAEWEQLKKISTPTITPAEEEQANAFFNQVQHLQSERAALESELKKQSGLKDEVSESYFWYQEHRVEIEAIVGRKAEYQAEQTELTALTTTIQLKNQQLAQLSERYQLSTTPLPELLTVAQKEVLAQSLADYQALKMERTTQTLAVERQKSSVGKFIFGGLALLAVVIATLFKPLVAVILALVLAVGAFVFWHRPNERAAATPAPSEKSNVKLAQFERDFQTIAHNLALGQVPLSLMLEADNPVSEFLQLHTELLQLTNEQTQRLQKNSATQQQWHALFSFLQPGTLFENLAQIETFQNEMARITFAKEQSSARDLEGRIYQLKEKINALDDQARPLLEKMRLATLYQVPQLVQENAVRRQKLARKAVLQQQLAELDYHEQSFYDIDALNEQLASARQTLAETQKRQQVVKVASETLSADGTLQSLEQDEATKEAEVLALAHKWAVKKLATSLLQDLAKELSEQQLPRLLQLVSENFATLTSQHYRRIVLKTDEIQVQRQDGLLFQLKDLSSGTKDQLFIAFRLAFLTLQGKKFAAPVIIDDGWLHYDQKRKQTLVDVLQKMGGDNQIILLSSDQDMLKIFQARGLAYQNLGDNS